MRPKLLDLFCCQGGAGTGYTEAGFDVHGIDIDPQPHYPFKFTQHEAISYLEMNWRNYDAIHASPPCQGYTSMTKYPEAQAKIPKLIPAMRELLDSIGLPYVIENVTGARREMLAPALVHGGHVGLTVDRPRLFETNWPLVIPKVKRVRAEYGIYGPLDGRRLWDRKDGTTLRAPKTLEEARRVMGMPWATWDGIREAIPPAYTRLIGEQLLNQIRA